MYNSARGSPRHYIYIHIYIYQSCIYLSSVLYISMYPFCLFICIHVNRTCSTACTTTPAARPAITFTFTYILVSINLVSIYQECYTYRCIISVVITQEQTCSSDSRFRRKLSGTTGHRLLGTQRPQMLCVAAWVWFCLSTEFVAVYLYVYT